MKVFVTGATGFVGREVLWQLNEAGQGIRFASRRGDSDAVRQLAYRYRAEIADGSFDRPDELARHLAGCEAVIHLVGIISETRRATFEKVHVEGTRAILEAARSAGAKRFVHMSALGSRAGARSRYHQTKWQAEELVRASGLDWTIFRPSVIYGREDGFVNLLAKICRWSPIIPVFGSGRNKLQPIAVEQVARAFVGALSRSESIAQTYDLCGDEVFTMDELFSVILGATHRWRPRIHLPMALARFQAACMEAMFALVNRPSPLTRDQLLMLEEDNVGEPAAARTLFGLVGNRFADGIATYVK